MNISEIENDIEFIALQESYADIAWNNAAINGYSRWMFIYKGQEHFVDVKLTVNYS